jgi:O-antigen/teichoic acid export membrane protein
MAAVKSTVSAWARRPFVRKVATVATGAAAAQGITMAFAPLLTRLYGPEAFGVQGVFVSVVGLLGVVAALGYPMAIVLPPAGAAGDAEAASLVRLSLALGLVTALLSGLMLLVVGADLLALLNAQAVQPYMAYIPLAMFGTVLAAVLGQWLVRRQAFALGALGGAGASLLLNAGKAALGLVQPTAATLVATHTLAGLAGTAGTALAARWRGAWGGLHGGQTPAESAAAAASAASAASAAMASQAPLPMAETARRHADFPRYRTPQNLINAFSQSLPLLMLAGSFGAASAGQYAVAMAVLAVPSSLIGSSVMSVFYPRITAAVHGGEDARALIVQATGGMAGMGALPFGLVLIAGPALFSLVFGADWRQAGVYAQWLALWMFFQYVNMPSVAAVPALGLQRGLLVYEVFSTGTKVGALWLGQVLFRSDIAAVALFCGVGVLAYLWLILWVLRNARRHPQRPASPNLPAA